ncbi:MAG TPA: discoidin domain-containing protein, partial [Planctomycetia bacterium]|nr:discoidin domain-containing protein [Planctomycetia bacterium]
TLAGAAKPSASHCNSSDTVEALHDAILPKSSDDGGVPRFTWWDHQGTKEWVQYDFEGPRRVGGVSVYWWDERRVGRHCRAPQSWRVLYKAGDSWRPVAAKGDYRAELDRFNRVEFEPVETTALRLEVQLQAGWSGGILEWTVD